MFLSSCLINLRTLSVKFVAVDIMKHKGCIIMLWEKATLLQQY
jgi:hypothetical protein